MIIYGMVRVKLAHMGQNGAVESLTECFEHGISQKSEESSRENYIAQMMILVITQ